MLFYIIHDKNLHRLCKIYYIYGELMKFIYVKNYLKTSREQKINFLKFINEFDEIKMTNQKILLMDNSILFEFSKDTNTDHAKLVIDKFFKENSEIEALVLETILMDKDTLTLVINKNEIKKVAL